jgi:hypothetical protein
MEPALALTNEDGCSIGPELVLRFVAGEKEAFGLMFELLHRDLFYVVRRYFFGAFDQ